ncbi:hypothetical protein PV325_001542 [Microctonus aethiopoides]|nr:hypothetical protein PV325_001542 [Microctonus aethiopoides]
MVPNKTLHPSALATMEGTSAELRCTICISPIELYTIESVEWFYNRASNIRTVDILVETTEHITISADDRTLTLFNVQKNQEGIYWCKMESMQSMPYFLHVITGTEPILMVRPNEAPNFQHSIPPTFIYDIGLKVYSSWTTWSPCSTCNAVGKRIRYGYCMVSLIDFTKKITSSSEPNKMQLINSVYNVLSIFQNKLPCRSWYTPDIIQEIFEVKNRATEIMTTFCKVKCRDNVVFEVRDNKGNILESANNSAGIYSMIQGMPDIRPSTVRVIQYGIHDTYTEIKCPGNLNIDLPIVWQIGTKKINTQTINQQSQGRISVDFHNRIIFKKLRYADANIYSCWQRNELAGTVRLRVSYELTSGIDELDHRVLMLVSIPVVFTMLWVFWRAFRGRNRYTKH